MSLPFLTAQSLAAHANGGRRFALTLLLSLLLLGAVEIELAHSHGIAAEIGCELCAAGAGVAAVAVDGFQWSLPALLCLVLVFAARYRPRRFCAAFSARAPPVFSL